MPLKWKLFCRRDGGNYVGSWGRGGWRGHARAVVTLVCC